MKTNFIKYIFILVVIILIGFAVYTIYKEEDIPQNQIPAENIEQEVAVATDLRLAIVGFDTMNPILSNNKNVQDISRLIFESLLTVDENYKLKLCLAKEWSRTGDTSYIIRLRDDVKWQDGSKLTAKDVQFTIDRLKDTPSIYSYNVQHVIGVEIIDEYTLKINLDQKIPFFEYNLTFPILSNNFYLDQDFVNTDKNKTPVATGMYKITSNEGSTITLKKNKNWWGLSEKDAKIETIIINLYNSMGEAYNSFKIGNIDLITTQSINIEDYIGTIGFNKKEYKGREYDFLAINCANNLLSREEVRKAISFSIDKNSIISNVYNGKYYNCNFPLDFDTWIYEEDSSSSGYNLEQAKQVLIDNGWEYKYNYWQKYENYKTIRLSFNLLVNSENSQRVSVAEIIKSNLESLGIRIKIISVPAKQFNNYLESRNYDLILTGTNVSIGPDLSTYFGNNNLANYQNEEVTSIINDLPNISDENMLKQKYKRLSEIYKTEVPYISLYFNRGTVAYSSNLIGELSPNNYNIFYNIDKWYRQY